MVGGNITITGNAIPDQLIARPMLLNMIPQAGDNDAATQFKVAARASLGVPDEQLTPILNEWYATYNLFNDRYNQQAIALATPTGIDSQAQQAIEQQYDSDLKASIVTFLKELQALDSNAPQKFMQHLANLKARTQWNTTAQNAAALPGSLTQISLGRAQLKQADITYMYNENGYVYTMDSYAAISGSGVNGYHSFTVTGHSASNNWTCTWDSYHQVWVPYPGCTLCGAGIPCHTPTVSLSLSNGNQQTTTGPAVAPNVNVNTAAYAYDAISPWPGSEPTATASGSIYCSGAGEALDGTGSLLFDISSVGIRVANGTVISKTSTCTINSLLCTNGAYITPSTVSPPSTNSCFPTGAYYGDTISVCVKPHSQVGWLTEDCSLLVVEPSPTSTVLPRIACDTYPK